MAQNKKGTAPTVPPIYDKPENELLASQDLGASFLILTRRDLVLAVQVQQLQQFGLFGCCVRGQDNFCIRRRKDVLILFAFIGYLFGDLAGFLRLFFLSGFGGLGCCFGLFFSLLSGFFGGSGFRVCLSFGFFFRFLGSLGIRFSFGLGFFLGIGGGFSLSFGFCIRLFFGQLFRFSSSLSFCICFGFCFLLRQFSGFLGISLCLGFSVRFFFS